MTSENHQSERVGEPSGFVERSHRLQDILRAAGFRKGNGISGEGIRLVSRVAKREGIRDWPHTRTWSDYDSLIAAVEKELGNVAGQTRPERSEGRCL